MHSGRCRATKRSIKHQINVEGCKQWKDFPRKRPAGCARAALRKNIVVHSFPVRYHKCRLQGNGMYKMCPSKAYRLAAIMTFSPNPQCSE